MPRDGEKQKTKNIEDRSPAEPEPNGDVRAVKNTEDTESTEGHRVKIWYFPTFENSIAISLYTDFQFLLMAERNFQQPCSHGGTEGTE
jgi:hypothetical protein